MSPKPPSLLILSTTILLFFFIFFPSISSTEFIFNNFTTSNQSNLLLFGSARIEPESSTLTLTNDTTFTIGRALYFSKIPTIQNSSYVLPFSSSFIFSIAPYKNLLPGHGFAFIFTPNATIDDAKSAQHLGLFNLTNEGKSYNHVFAVEFDVFKNQAFNDINDNHVAIDINSLTSFASNEAGFWGGGNDDKFKKLKLNNGVNYQVWIDYKDMEINVTMAKAGVKRPTRPLINATVNLSSVLLDEMYVGFTGATGLLVQSHRILSWGFSNSNFLIGDALSTTNLPSFVVGKGSFYRSAAFIVGITVGVVFVFVCVMVVYLVLLRRKRRNQKLKEGVEDWEVEYWPHRIVYLVWLRRKQKRKERIEDWEVEYWPHRIGFQEIEAATKGFSEENVIGSGGNGKVYKGVLPGGQEVAVKIISYEKDRGMREFLAEVSSLGRLKHRSLVGLIGWCKRATSSLILVYHYMENGSLDKRLFGCEQNMMLSWEERIKVLKDVASGILYMHEGWEVKVLHRDIKASNVLLDKDMNARLGDFGLARMHLHKQHLASTTQVVGTVGYMAPEVVQLGRVSAQADVFGFGVLVLEVISGRRPVEEGKPNLVDWVWRLMERGDLVGALDERIKDTGIYIDDEVARVLHLGLLCVYPDPRNRPTMRQVVKALELSSEELKSQGEGMEANFLDKTRIIEIWYKYHRSFGIGRQPTFKEMHTIYSSISLSESDIITEGR